MSRFQKPTIDTGAISDFEPRCPIVLLLDTSHSMKGPRLEELKEGLGVFLDDLKEDPQACRRVEIAICAFGNEEIIYWEFEQAKDFSLPTLEARGTTPIGAAMNYGMDEIEKRTEQYKSEGRNFYQPWIFLITDGEPTDEWRSAAERIKAAQQEDKVAFFVVGVYEANMRILNELSTNNAKKLAGLRFSELFLWISKNLIQVSRKSSEGSEIKMTSTNQWEALTL